MAEMIEITAERMLALIAAAGETAPADVAAFALALGFDPCEAAELRADLAAAGVLEELPAQ